jgi:hypothetical protein
LRQKKLKHSFDAPKLPWWHCNCGMHLLHVAAPFATGPFNGSKPAPAHPAASCSTAATAGPTSKL